MRVNLNKKIILIIIGVIGLVVPFIHYLTIIEMFFLLIPFAIIFIATLIYLITSLLNKTQNRRKAIFIFSILPIFVFSQLLSSYTVDKIQRFRSEKLIEEVEEHTAKTVELPNNIKAPHGIEYEIMNDRKSFLITYSRGFMVIEKYQSKYKQWRSYGWND